MPNNEMWVCKYRIFSHMRNCRSSYSTSYYTTCKPRYYYLILLAPNDSGKRWLIFLFSFVIYMPQLVNLVLAWPLEEYRRKASGKLTKCVVSLFPTFCMLHVRDLVQAVVIFFMCLWIFIRSTLGQERVFTSHGVFPVF